MEESGELIFCAK